MRIAVNNSDQECSSKEEMERIIREAKEKGLNHIWIAGETDYPCITILRIKELARILYFENGEGRIWQSAGTGSQGEAHGTISDDILMPECSAVPLSYAVMCAKDFWEKQRRSECISWSKF